MKMKNRLGMIVILLLALTLTTYSCYLSADSDISQAWKGERTSRTWTVYDFEGQPPNKFHLQKDDVFRIEEKGPANIHFIPHGVLRGRWDRDEGSFIKLDKKGQGNNKLCGKLKLKNHPDGAHRTHFIVVEAHPNNKNIILIKITDDEGFSCANVTHGGIAHARN
jgi:hypothetical protein